MTFVRPMIFVVEDDVDIARLVRHHLESAGYAVRPFASSQKVISDAEKHAIADPT
jgi:two-component system phosphate regulon response regulator PhoB